MVNCNPPCRFFRMGDRLAKAHEWGMRMYRGYVKLWRKTLDSGLLRNGPAWQLFGYLLMRATHRAHRQILGSSVLDLRPGQVIFGRTRAAADLSLGEQQVRTALALLRKLDMITSERAGRCTIVTLSQWTEWNAPEKSVPVGSGGQEAPGFQPEMQADTAPLSEPDAIRKPTTNKNGKEWKEKRHTAPRASGGDGRGLSPGRVFPAEPCYQARSGRFLTGDDLRDFSRFWQDFGLPRGKAEAADAWLDIPGRSPDRVEHICHAARCEAAARPELEARGRTPKWAQGWLNGRRWEDHAPRAAPAPPVRESWDLPPEEIERRRQISREQARLWRQGKRGEGEGGDFPGEGAPAPRKVRAPVGGDEGS